MTRQILLIIIILFGFLPDSLAYECRIVVKDFKDNPVSFVLESINIKLSSDNGVLIINDSEYNTYQESRFKLDFADKLAKFIYDKKLISESPENQLAQDGYYILKNLCKGEEDVHNFIVPNLKRGLNQAY